MAEMQMLHLRIVLGKEVDHTGHQTLDYVAVGVAQEVQEQSQPVFNVIC